MVLRLMLRRINLIVTSRNRTFLEKVLQEILDTTDCLPLRLALAAWILVIPEVAIRVLSFGAECEVEGAALA